MKRLFSLVLVAAGLVLIPRILLGQGDLKVTGFTQSGSTITVTVQNTDSAPPSGTSTSFRMYGSPALPSNWTPAALGLPGFQPVPGKPGFFSATFTRPAGSRQFLQFVGIKAGPGDTDGDGLLDTFENSNPTWIGHGIYNPGVLDTDGDGYTDGEEFIYGTDAADPNSKPVFTTNKPTVQFVLGSTTATEGTTDQLQVIFDRTYSGTLSYRINPINTLDTNAPANGSISINGVSGSIPVPIADDASPSTDASSSTNASHAIVVELKLNGQNYFIGSRPSHVVKIDDNDAWWTGTLIPACGEVSSRIFRIKIAHNGGSVTAAFAAGAGNDGLPILDASESNGTSATLIPGGTWPATGVIDSATQFHAVSSVLIMPAGPILNLALKRQLTLNAQPALNTPQHPHVLVPNARYIGDYTETLLHPTTNAVLATYPGTFILVRDIPAPLPRLFDVLAP